MSSTRILLAEDNSNDAELTLDVLARTHLSVNVDVVADGVEALEYLTFQGKYTSRTRSNPDLVLLDLKMPRMDGLQVLKVIRENVTLQTLPVVVLSSSREESDIQRSYDLGANAYVVKPVDFGAFSAAVGALGKFWAGINEAPRWQRE